MAKKSLCFTALLLVAALLCSCSFLQSAMEEAGLDADLREKIDTAWSEVAKDGIKDVLDDAWREYGLGRSIDWPTKGSAAALPKLRDGTVRFALADSSGEFGSICIAGASESNIEKYKQKLASLGYAETQEECSLSELYVCDGLLVGFAGHGGALFIIYGRTAEEIDAAYAAALEEAGV
ncbi:MAG: hypothetical protein J5760_03320 [Clostridia bacterium]|nr:hypothetical protein [Clostridia bacterium]